MAIADIFELRVEFQDLIVDVALTHACGCADAVRTARAEGNNNPRACLGCRARYVMQLGRAVRGWSPFPMIGIRHEAGRAYRSVEVTLTASGRRRPARTVGGRQVCVHCGEILGRGSIGPWVEPGEVVVTYGARYTPLGVLTAQGLVGRDPRQAEPGQIECAVLVRAVPSGPVGVGASPDAAGGPVPRLDDDAGPRR